MLLAANELEYIKIKQPEGHRRSTTGRISAKKSKIYQGLATIPCGMKFRMLFVTSLLKKCIILKLSEYDQEMPQSLTTEQLMAQRGRVK